MEQRWLVQAGQLFHRCAPFKTLSYIKAIEPSRPRNPRSAVFALGFRSQEAVRSLRIERRRDIQPRASEVESQFKSFKPFNPPGSRQNVRSRCGLSRSLPPDSVSSPAARARNTAAATKRPINARPAAKEAPVFPTGLPN
jgi:hypothetical protein